MKAPFRCLRDAAAPLCICVPDLCREEAFALGGMMPKACTALGCYICFRWVSSVRWLCSTAVPSGGNTLNRKTLNEETGFFLFRCRGTFLLFLLPYKKSHTKPPRHFGVCRREKESMAQTVVRFSTETGSTGLFFFCRACFFAEATKCRATQSPLAAPVAKFCPS